MHSPVPVDRSRATPWEVSATHWRRSPLGGDTHSTGLIAGVGLAGCCGDDAGPGEAPCAAAPVTMHNTTNPACRRCFISRHRRLRCAAVRGCAIAGRNTPPNWLQERCHGWLMTAKFPLMQFAPAVTWADPADREAADGPGIPPDSRGRPRHAVARARSAWLSLTSTAAVGRRCAPSRCTRGPSAWRRSRIPPKDAPVRPRALPAAW